MFKERNSHNHNLIILQLNCGWHGNDKHWKRGGNHQDYPYKGTPNNNLSEKIPFLWVVLPIHNEMFKFSKSLAYNFYIFRPVRARRPDGLCGLDNRATYPDTTEWKYTEDQVTNNLGYLVLQISNI